MLLYEITFTLDGLTPDAYADLAAQLAPEFARLPGLVHKTWIREGDRFGGVYLWRDRASYEAMLGSPLDAASNPAFRDIRTRLVDVLDVPTTLTTPEPVAV